LVCAVEHSSVGRPVRPAPLASYRQPATGRSDAVPACRYHVDGSRIDGGGCGRDVHRWRKRS
jgi:hypothetical protein